MPDLLLIVALVRFLLWKYGNWAVTSEPRVNSCRHLIRLVHSSIRPLISTQSSSCVFGEPAKKSTHTHTHTHTHEVWERPVPRLTAEYLNWPTSAFCRRHFTAAVRQSAASGVDSSVKSKLTTYCIMQTPRRCASNERWAATLPLPTHSSVLVFWARGLLSDRSLMDASENRVHKYKKIVIFHLFRQKTPWTNFRKIWHSTLSRVITCDKFLTIGWGVWIL